MTVSLLSARDAIEFHLSGQPANDRRAGLRSDNVSKQASGRHSKPRDQRPPDKTEQVPRRRADQARGHRQKNIRRQKPAQYPRHNRLVFPGPDHTLDVLVDVRLKQKKRDEDDRQRQSRHSRPPDGSPE